MNRNNKYKFAFVVLHFLTTEDTIECVESILNTIEYDNYIVIIVDNGSPNNSGKILYNRYKGNSKVKVIINDKNLGFAQGNNIGYIYAKYELKCNFIALINNDTIINQNKFISLILENYTKTKFYILGPDILSLKNGKHQNPSPVTLQNIDTLKKYLTNYRISLILNYILLDRKIENFKKKIIKKPILVPPVKPLTYQAGREIHNVKLHGSALVFSPGYVAKYDGLNPKTFVYGEEAILFFTAKRDGLLTVYDPKVKILHKEDSSTEFLFPKSYIKRRFDLKNQIRSGKVLLNLMKENKEETETNEKL